MGLPLQTQAGQFIVGEPVVYGQLWRRVMYQDPGRNRVSPAEHELGIPSSSKRRESGCEAAFWRHSSGS